MQVAAVSSLGGWIQVTADYILRLTRVLAARHELWLTPSHSWLEFRWLDTSCGWLCPTELSSGGQIRVTADYTLRLARVPTVGYDLRLIPSCSWLEFWRLNASCSWFHPAAGYELQLTRVPPAGIDLQLFYTLIYQVNLRTCSAKYIIFYGLFSAAWFQLPLIQALPAASRTLKKLEEAWRNFRTLAVTDCSCSGWFETCDQSATSRILIPIPPDKYQSLDQK